jgi:outer membrane protein TolC
LLFVVRSDADQVLTFPHALERALRTRGATATFERQAEILESLPTRTAPIVRAESGFSNLVTERVDHFNGLTTLVSVDYPLFDRGAAQRRADALRFDAQRLRQRAIEEEDEVFEQTLVAFGDLAAAEQRMSLLREGASRAAKLRERTRVMLEIGQISNVTAAQWQDQALAAESMLIDLELQRLNAETRLKQLMGDTTPARLHAKWGAGVPPAGPKASGLRHSLHEQRARLDLDDASASARPQFLLSAYGGVADYNGTFGIYGLRFTVTFDPSAGRRMAAERIAFENAERARVLAERAEQNRLELLQLELSAAERRVGLLTQSIDVARKREESVARLVSAGVRTEADVVATASEIARRESDLAGARIEAWKLQQRIARSTSR